MRTDEPPVVVEQTFDASIEAVWNAITDVSKMTQWYFDNIPAFKPEVGFETRFTVISQGRTFPHRWTVREVDPPRKLAYRWQYENYLGDAVVTFELSKVGEGTRLKLTNTVLEDFPDEIPEFKWESCRGGWQFFICERLKAYLEDNL